MQGDRRGGWMWSDAAELLQITDRLERQYFQAAQSADPLCWVPSVDMHQRSDGLAVWVALPGVAPDRYEVLLEHSTLILRGERPLEAAIGSGAIFHLEIPYGRFERRVCLPHAGYRIVDLQLENGCLRLRLERLS